MPSTLTDTKNADASFYEAVVTDSAFASALVQFGFDTYIDKSQHNAGLAITKSAWHLPYPEGHLRTITVYYAVRDRCEVRVSAGLDPYIGGLEKKPEEKAKLAPVLARKTRILHALRNRLLNAPDVPSRFDANTNRLLSPDASASIGAVKFSGCGYGVDPTVEQAARWFADVIKTITPIVEEVVAQNKATS